jgi:hypothetical protein
MGTIRLISLHCRETEDWTGSDEIRLWVVGNRNHEYYRDMNNGQTWDINDEVPFTVKARMEVWDLDAGRWWDPHDLLGVHYATDDMAGQGPKSATYDAYGARYDLTYEVLGASRAGSRGGTEGRERQGEIRKVR